MVWPFLHLTYTCEVSAFSVFPKVKRLYLPPDRTTPPMFSVSELFPGIAENCLGVHHANRNEASIMPSYQGPAEIGWCNILYGRSGIWSGPKMEDVDSPYLS